MFFPQDAQHFTAFDPNPGSLTRLSFSPQDGAVTIELANGQRVTLARLTPTSTLW